MAFQDDRASAERWLDALLVMGTVVVAFVLIGYLGSDLLLLRRHHPRSSSWRGCWRSSSARWSRFLVRHVPCCRGSSRSSSCTALLLGVILVLAVVIANTLATSISDFIEQHPQPARATCPTSCAVAGAPQRARASARSTWRRRPTRVPRELNSYASQLVGPAPAGRNRQPRRPRQRPDRGDPVAVHGRRPRPDPLVPLPARARRTASEEAALLETSVAASFGGFLRGQAIMGAVYAADRGRRCASCSGSTSCRSTAFAAGMLMAIPFFGPFIAWVPPVLAAILFQLGGHAARPDRDGRGLVRRDEHPPAAPDGAGRRHPPDRRPGVGAHRVEGRRHHRRHLRHPDRGGRRVRSSSITSGGPATSRRWRRAPPCVSPSGRGERSASHARPDHRPTSHRRKPPLEVAPRTGTGAPAATAAASDSPTAAERPRPSSRCPSARPRRRRSPAGRTSRPTTPERPMPPPRPDSDGTRERARWSAGTWTWSAASRSRARRSATVRDR